MAKATKCGGRIEAKRVASKNKLAQATRSLVESIEPRRLFAFVAVGTPGVLAASGVNAVESAAARPDPTNNVRYASYVTTAGLGFVSQVAGANSQMPNTPVQINSPLNDTVSNTDVAANNLTSNTYVVVWQNTHTPVVNNTPGTPDSDILAQVFSSGIAVSGVITVNSSTAGNQTDPRVAMDASGNFIVVWQTPVNGTTQIFARRFTADGTSRGGETNISNAVGNAVEPDVAVNNAGRTAIVWSTTGGTVSQLFDANLQVIGTQQAINSETFAEPAVAVANNGMYVVAYSATVNSIKNIMIARFNADGTPNGAPAAAAVDTTVNQNVPELSIDTAGNYAVGWAQATTAAPTTYSDAAFRVFHSTGVAYGPETVLSNVKFGSDFRFGVALRVPGQLQIAYADPAGEALMQTYADDTAPPVAPTPPAGAVVVTAPAGTASTIVVSNNSSTIFVTLNGVTTSYSRSNHSSVFITGSSAADRTDLRGFSLASQVYAGDGNDTIFGGTGADSIDAGDGDDAVQAGDGNDYVYGGDGTDTIFGGAGDDRLLGGPGRGNQVYGEDGSDTLLAGSRGDALYGGAGGDSLVGGAGGDYLDGGLSNDTLIGNAGTDVLFGNNGNDYIDGGADNDSIVGGRGNDLCYGGRGNDTLVGGANADTLKGGDGQDYGYYDLLDTLISVTYRIAVR